MDITKRSPTTKDIALLYQLHTNGQLTLAAEFQRNAVWPTAAKAYLIDTILNDRPIPLLFFQRATSAQKGVPSYTVIDGQQRLRAIFEFIEDRFRLTQSNKKARYYNKRFSDLVESVQEQIRNYDLIIEELSGYSDNDIRDMFIRINRYVVQLSPQELRHAKGSGRFHDFVEKLGADPFWKTYKIFSAGNLKRMRAVEFSAELAILISEGPQDKKTSIDLYYGQYQKKFPQEAQLTARLRAYFNWIAANVPNFSSSRYRKSVDLYALIGAMHRIAGETGTLNKLSSSAGARLAEFDKRTRVKEPTGDAARYLVAASRQTDNLTPRVTRIEILGTYLRD